MSLKAYSRKLTKKEIQETSNELKKMFDEDQYYAKNYIAKKFKATIMNNTRKLNRIIKKYGWPNEERFGRAAETGAWVTAQHNDWNVKFQEKCLKLMQALPPIKRRKQNIAYLTDRILVNKRRRQIYGTQFTMGRDGKMKPRPIRDIKNLDERRKQAGLENSKIYEKRMAEYNKLK